MYNSDYANSFRSSLRNQPSPYAQKPKSNKPKWLIPAIVGVVILVILVIVLATVMPGVKEQQEQADFMEQSYNIADDEETITGDYKEAVAKNPHASYGFTEPNTPYVDLQPNAVCEALGISCSSLKNPAKDAKFVKTGAMNSYALDYYLDSGNIVVMKAHYDAFGDMTLVIYGRKEFFYAFFEPEKSYTEYEYTTRSVLFNDIVGVPEFYILKGITDGA